MIVVQITQSKNIPNTWYCAMIFYSLSLCNIVLEGKYCVMAWTILRWHNINRKEYYNEQPLNTKSPENVLVL